MIHLDKKRMLFDIVAHFHFYLGFLFVVTLFTEDEIVFSISQFNSTRGNTEANIINKNFRTFNIAFNSYLRRRKVHATAFEDKSISCFLRKYFRENIS